MPQIQVLNCKDFIIFSVSCDGKLNYFGGFRELVRQKKQLKVFRIQMLIWFEKKIICNLNNNESRVFFPYKTFKGLEPCRVFCQPQRAPPITGCIPVSLLPHLLVCVIEVVVKQKTEQLVMKLWRHRLQLSESTRLKVLCGQRTCNVMKEHRNVIYRRLIQAVWSLIVKTQDLAPLFDGFFIDL